MKTTGVIRRIDELGRIVIPKEIRKNLRIKDGENIEIMIENENVILKKFSELNKIVEISQVLADSIYSILKKNIIIADNDAFTSISGSLKDTLIDKPISNQIIELIKDRTNLVSNKEEIIYLSNDYQINCNYCLSTIIVNGDAAGMVMILSNDDKISEFDGKICQLAALFLAKMLED